MSLKAKRLARKQDSNTKPYIVQQHERITKSGVEANIVDPLSSAIPANKEVLEIAERYRGALPRLLKDKIPEVRDFFLKDIAPYSLGISNGLQDANDILTSALDESVDTSSYISKIENLVHIGLEVKMIYFVKKFLGLSEDESQRYLLTVFSKEVKTEDLASVLAQLVKASEVEKPVEQQPARRLINRKRR